MREHFDYKSEEVYNARMARPKSKNFDLKKAHTFDPNGKKVLAISAHPDDMDFGGSGTLMQWLKQGAKAAIVIATNGDKGTSDTSLTSRQLAKLRRDEQLHASTFLGLEQTWFLDYPDAHLEITQNLKEKLIRIIREYKPDAVMTFDPTMVYSLKLNYINHPDHRAIGQATIDAVFPMARDFLVFPEHQKSGLAPHKVSDIFLYNFDHPNYYVDITSVIDRKIELLGLHESQIDTSTVEPFVRQWNAMHGQVIGTKYAEAFLHIHLR